MKVHLFFTVSRRLPSVLNLLVLNQHLKDKIKNKTPSSNETLLQRGDGACSFDLWDAYLLPHTNPLVSLEVPQVHLGEQSFPVVCLLFGPISSPRW